MPYNVRVVVLTEHASKPSGPFCFGKAKEFLRKKTCMRSRLSTAVGLIRAVQRDLLLVWVFLCCPSELGVKNSTGSKCASSLYGRQQE